MLTLDRKVVSRLMPPKEFSTIRTSHALGVFGTPYHQPYGTPSTWAKSIKNNVSHPSSSPSFLALRMRGGGKKKFLPPMNSTHKFFPYIFPLTPGGASARFHHTEQKFHNSSLNPKPQFDRAFLTRRFNLLDTVLQGTSFFDGKMGIFNLCGMIFQKERVSSPEMENALFFLRKYVKDSFRIGGDDLCRS